ncbi:MAG: MFS transporter [Gammaproteobacteria bacterium]
MAESPRQAPQKAGINFGPRVLNLVLVDGVSRRNVLTLLFGSFFGIAMMSFINASQPYIFTEILHIPTSEQGRLAGDMTFYQEILIIMVIGFVGALSDKIGRKPLYAGAFVVIGLGYFLYPLAENVETLIAFRMVFAIGFAMNASMLPAVANDYPIEQSRAKMLSVCFFLNGLGFILVLTPLRLLLPFFGEIAPDAIWAGRYWLWTAASIALMVSTVLTVGLKSGAPEQLEKRDSFFATVTIGIRAARRPRIALAYIAAVVSRGDMSVLSTFFTLWLTQAGIEAGMSTAEASGQAIKFYILIQVFALLWLGCLVFILDKIDRVVSLAIAMVLAGGGYFTLYLISDPFGPQMYAASALVGMGEMSANISALTLIGSEAPVKGRGAVIGLFSLFGAVGILMTAKFGGWLYSSWLPVGPFVLVACANVFVLFLALLSLIAFPAKK